MVWGSLGHGKGVWGGSLEALMGYWVILGNPGRQLSHTGKHWDAFQRHWDLLGGTEEELRGSWEVLKIYWAILENPKELLGHTGRF